MKSEAINIDCLEYMKTLPDNAFDLAVVDPPYGDGQQRERERETDGRTTDSEVGLKDTKPYNRFGGKFEKYKEPTRTGGTWAEKYGKKS